MEHIEIREEHYNKVQRVIVETIYLQLNGEGMPGLLRQAVEP